MADGHWAQADDFPGPRFAMIIVRVPWAWRGSIEARQPRGCKDGKGLPCISKGWDEDSYLDPAVAQTIKMLAARPDIRARWFSYEALVARPEEMSRWLCRWVGLTYVAPRGDTGAPGVSPWKGMVYDGNMPHAGRRLR